ncbi:MAG: hypothetical protein AABY89_07570, partial [Acidobacteriota bacterium]
LAERTGMRVIHVALDLGRAVALGAPWGSVLARLASLAQAERLGEGYQLWPRELRRGVGPGELVFEEPPTHTFDVGKYKDTDVAFPPGVTIKDYMWGGGIGYANPKPGASPASFPTVIQIVAAPGRVASPPR